METYFKLSTVKAVAAILLCSACSQMEYVPQKRNYTAEGVERSYAEVPGKFKPLGELHFSNSDKEHDDSSMRFTISRYKSVYKASTPLFYSDSPVDFSVQAGRGDVAAGVHFTYRFK